MCPSDTIRAVYVTKRKTGERAPKVFTLCLFFGSRNLRIHEAARALDAPLRLASGLEARGHEPLKPEHKPGKQLVIYPRNTETHRKGKGKGKDASK